MIDYNKKYAKFNKNDANLIVVDSRTLNDDNTITYNLHDGRSVTLKTSQVGIEEVSHIKVTSKQIVVTYGNGTTKTISSIPKTLSEVYIARHELQERLTKDLEFIDGLKVDYSTQTINKLLENLTNWLDSDEDKFVLRGKVKELYSTAMTKIENEKKSSLVM